MRPVDADRLYQKAIDIINDEADDKAMRITVGIMLADTVEAELVKHGKWFVFGTNKITKTFYCSECFGFVRLGRYACIYNYCPECGAKMEGVVEYD